MLLPLIFSPVFVVRNRVNHNLLGTMRRLIFPAWSWFMKNLFEVATKTMKR